MKTKYELTSQRAVRAAFWDECGNLPSVTRRRITNYSGTGKMYNANTRCTFSGWLDGACKAGRLSAELTDRVTM